MSILQLCSNVRDDDSMIKQEIISRTEDASQNDYLREVPYFKQRKGDMAIITSIINVFIEIVDNFLIPSIENWFGDGLILGIAH